MEFGYAFFANQKLITIFSASRYEDSKNWSAVAIVDKTLEVTFRIFQPHEYDPFHASSKSSTSDTIDSSKSLPSKQQEPSLSLIQPVTAIEISNAK